MACLAWPQSTAQMVEIGPCQPSVATRERGVVTVRCALTMKRLPVVSQMTRCRSDDGLSTSGVRRTRRASRWGRSLTVDAGNGEVAEADRGKSVCQ
jgi:hypothetical protein